MSTIFLLKMLFEYISLLGRFKTVFSCLRIFETNTSSWVSCHHCDHSSVVCIPIRTEFVFVCLNWSITLFIPQFLSRAASNITNRKLLPRVVKCICLFFSLLCIDLYPPWLSLFWGILLFLMKFSTRFFLVSPFESSLLVQKRQQIFVY